MLESVASPGATIETPSIDLACRESGSLMFKFVLCE